MRKNVFFPTLLMLFLVNGCGLFSQETKGLPSKDIEEIKKSRDRLQGEKKGLQLQNEALQVKNKQVSDENRILEAQNRALTRDRDELKREVWELIAKLAEANVGKKKAAKLEASLPQRAQEEVKSPPIKREIPKAIPIVKSQPKKKQMHEAKPLQGKGKKKDKVQQQAREQKASSAQRTKPKIKVLAGDRNILTAQSLAKQLEAMGYPVSRTDLAPEKVYRGTKVYVIEGFKKEGKGIASQLGENAAVRSLSWPSVFDIIIVTDSTGELQGQ